MVHLPALCSEHWSKLDLFVNSGLLFMLVWHFQVFITGHDKLYRQSGLEQLGVHVEHVVASTYSGEHSHSSLAGGHPAVVLLLLAVGLQHRSGLVAAVMHRMA